ncbi:hypothetical protein [Persicobacter psychrovividus]
MAPDTVEREMYFPVKSTVDQLKTTMEKQQPAIEQQILIGAERESKKIAGQEVNWTDQFKILDDLDLNKPVLQGMYRKDSTAQTVTYTLKKADPQAKVNWLKVKYLADGSQQINATLKSSTLVHKAERTVELQWKNERLLHYTVSGLTKVILEDTVHYQISMVPQW